MWGAEGAQGTFALPLEVGAFLAAFALREGLACACATEGKEQLVRATRATRAGSLTSKVRPPPPLS